MKKTIKFTVVLLMILFESTTFYSCKKDINTSNDLAQIEQAAYKTLKSVMPINDFSDLKWKDVVISSIKNNTGYILKINSLSDSSKFLLFASDGNSKVYNWVQAKVDMVSKNGIINLFSASDGGILKEYRVVNNRVQSYQNNVGGITTMEEDPTTDLPDVVITDYTYDLGGVTVSASYPAGSYGYDYLSLYWLLQQNVSYFDQFMINGSPTFYANSFPVTISVPNYPGFTGGTTYAVSATETKLANGNIQVSFTDTKSAALVNISVRFQYNPNLAPGVSFPGIVANSFSVNSSGILDVITLDYQPSQTFSNQTEMYVWLNVTVTSTYPINVSSSYTYAIAYNYYSKIAYVTASPKRAAAP